MTDSLAQNVLSYWHCVEFFNHYDLDDQIKTARDGKRREFFLSLPRLNEEEWAKHEGTVRYLYLLPFDVSQITEVAIAHTGAASALAKPRDEEFAPEGTTCFAKLRLSAEGVPDFKTLSLSTLPWAGGMLSQGRLDELHATAFEESVVNVKLKIESAWSCRTDEKCTPEFLRVLAEVLVDWAGYRPRGNDIAWVDVQKDAPKFVAKQPAQPSIAEAENQDDIPAPVDELPILNSFFYHDLKLAAAAMRQATIEPNPLRAYLSAGGIDKLDLETPAGEQTIHAALDPVQTNAGRWPTEPVLLQSLMQQFALNKMRALPPGGLISVNGPPGTGKTTLVKDLIADLIIQRADVLVKLNKAKEGFPTQVTIGFGNDAATTIPALAPALTGFEIVVSSSNNGAVENLSLELPQLADIAADHIETLRHFAEVATKYAGAQAGKPWKRPDKPVWGLISAALGNSKNRRRFQQVFVYTAATPSQLAGDRFLSANDVDHDAWDVEGAMTYWRFVRARRSSTPTFDSAKLRFLEARKSYAGYQVNQIALRKKWLAFVDAWTAARPSLELHVDLEHELQPLVDELDACVRRVDRQLEQLELTLWPSKLRWLMRWFSKRKFLAWLEAKSKTLNAANLRDDLEIVRKLQQKTGQLHLWDGQTLDSHRNQESALWHGSEYNERRNELFAAAMQLHQAFVMEAPAEVGRAISNLFTKRVTQGSPLPVWQWLFMLVPVVSSTFASVRNQFRGVEPGSFGWLIIDEAGQAIPQAAVGALLRSRRAVVVGDPLQIEPVVGIPTRLVEKLGEVWLGDHAGAYAANRHSVQTLADRAHEYGVRHPHREDEFIGIPLVMHRRCDNPMFDIANKIAYRERMRHAKNDPALAHPVLGKSDWWDVKGRCTEGKYVPEQGLYLMERLVALYVHEAQAGRAAMPKVYVITPFREVKRGLTELLLKKSEWARRLTPQGLAVPDNLEDLRDCIGTVHTFQGKEADIVFFVLGCDEERGGAMNWAASSPNLLNVAVTRAKKHCYIIGDKSLWGGLSNFETALSEYARFNAG